MHVDTSGPQAYKIQRQSLRKVSLITYKKKGVQMNEIYKQILFAQNEGKKSQQIKNFTKPT